MVRTLASMLLLVVLLLASCGRLGAPGGSPVPGPTPSVTPDATPLFGGGPERGGELPTDGPIVTG